MEIVYRKNPGKFIIIKKREKEGKLCLIMAKEMML